MSDIRNVAFFKTWIGMGFLGFAAVCVVLSLIAGSQLNATLVN